VQALTPVISGAELTAKNRRLQIDLEHRLNRWFQETSNHIGDALKKKYNPRAKKFVVRENLTPNVAKDDSDAEGDDLQTELLVGGKKIPKIQSDLIRALALLGWRAIDWEALVGIMQPYLEAAAKEGVDGGVGQVQMTDAAKAREAADRDAEEYAAKRAAELAGMKLDDEGNLEEDEGAHWALTDVMQRDLEASITQAVVEGWSPTQLAAVIEASYALSAERATIIANTELTNAQSGGTYSLWRQSGTITLVRWRVSAAHQNEDECDDYEDQGTVPLGHEFAEGLFSPRAHPYCRCQLEVVDPNEAFDPLEQ
jgi:uncharacterized protein YbdZ (MbtH family)